MNQYNPNIHHRRSIRLKGYDYSQAGLYFITICVQNRKCLFGEIVNREMILNDAGQLVETEWLKLPERFYNIELHKFVVMPNHFHAILEIMGATLLVAQNTEIVEPQNTEIVEHQNTEIGEPQNTGIVEPQKGQPQGIVPTDRPENKTIGDMVGAFQSIVTVEYIRGVKNMGWKPFDGKLWQRNYYEHIIRDEQSYLRISNYITNNPAKWADDKFYKH